MLEESLVASRPPARTRKPLTVLISASTHSGLVVALILIPLFQAPTLPQIPSLDVLRPLQVQVTRVAPTPTRDGAQKAPQQAPADLIAPTEIPRKIAIVNDAPMDTAGFLATLDGAPGAHDLLNRLLVPPGVGAPAPPPLPPPPPTLPAAAPEPPPAPPQGPLRVPGGQLEKSHLLHQVTPTYPPLAKQIRLEGTVVVEAVTLATARSIPHAFAWSRATNC